MYFRSSAIGISPSISTEPGCDGADRDLHALEPTACNALLITVIMQRIICFRKEPFPRCLKRYQAIKSVLREGIDTRERMEAGDSKRNDLDRG
jgi:hypothetical protein